jgi:hypothetical protein
MSTPKFRNLTVNWQGKKGQRGLTEAVLDLLRDYGVNHKRPSAITEAENLDHEYSNLWKDKVFPFDREFNLCEKYVRIRI